MVHWLSGWIAGGDKIDLRGNKDDSCHVVEKYLCNYELEDRLCYH